LGSPLPNRTSARTVSSTGSFSTTLSGLSSGTTYEFRAVAEAGTASDTGTVESFQTDSGGCFITTATAREPATLDSLRRFRDESMSTTPLGRGLVGLYYRISPPIAETLERHPESHTADVTRSIVRTCGSLSDAQDETDSHLGSALLGAVLTQLYVVGVLTAAAGHAGIRLRELLQS
jgi:subtilisin